MAAKYWIKLYMEILDDPKMGQLPDYLYRRAIELFLAAGENGNDGVLQPVPQLAWRLRLDEMKLRESLRALSEVGVVQETSRDVWVVTNFKKRQDAASPAERVKEYRKRNDYETKRYTSCNETCNVSVTDAPYTEADTDTDTESDTESTTTTAQAGENLKSAVILPKGTLIDANEACRIYTRVTGHTVPPSGQRGPIEEVLIDICHERGGAESTVKFLLPFWKEWNERKYSPTNAAWLLDWAVTRKIPARKAGPMPVAPAQIGKNVPPAQRQSAAFSKLNELEEALNG